MLDEKILNILRNNKDSYISGEELCGHAGISRAAIWKHIETLRLAGYGIEAVPHLGYKLVSTPDALIPTEIGYALNTRVFGREIISYKKCDSTNDIAYGLAEKGVKEGTVVIAEEQVKGKGRHGRTWSSPPKGGIYMSCILRPRMTPNEIPRITLLAAVAVAKAIRDFAPVEAAIKWPNDIVHKGRKLCGILTEMKAEQDIVSFLIVGIGINVNTPLKTLPKGATSIREESVRRRPAPQLSRVDLVRLVLQRLEEYYALLGKKGFEPIIGAWRELSAMTGARVRVTLPGRSLEGIAHDINTDGALILRLDSGVLENVSSGDVILVR
jgi:BirA family biotin operon repressor/biotin-[acetyl-CoA-carboxylase] ligase